MEVCTVDDFREWLSDNLRYILLGLAIIIVLVIAFFAVRFVTDRLGGDSDIKQTEAVTEAPAQQQDLRQRQRRRRQQLQRQRIRFRQTMQQSRKQ